MTWLEKLVLVWIDPRKTGRISLVWSILIDFAFIITKLGDGIYHRKAWPIAVGVYYFALFVIRVILFKALSLKSSRMTEQKTVKKVAVLILVLNIILVGMIVQMITSRVIIEYRMWIAVVEGLYLVYRISIAVVNAIKYSRHDRGIILTTVKYLNLIAAMVAVLMTQTTILMSLGEHDLNLMRILNGISGGIVALVVVGLSVKLLRKNAAMATT